MCLILFVFSKNQYIISTMMVMTRQSALLGIRFNKLSRCHSRIHSCPYAVLRFSHERKFSTRTFPASSQSQHPNAPRIELPSSPEYPDTSIEYLHPWITKDDEIKSLPEADCASRYVWQLVRDLYQYGKPQNDDKISTRRCSIMLKRLFQSCPQDSALRAERILRAMTLFDVVEMNNRLEMSATELPRPSKDIFNTVLKLYSVTPSTTREIPDRAYQVLKLMQQRYKHVPDALDCQPFAFHYNCVLQCWKECTSWERAVHAAQIVLKDMPENNVEPDDSCYITLLRICAHNLKDDKEREIGERVALRLWTNRFSNENPIAELPSHIYSHFLQALRFGPRPIFQAIWERAVQKGKVNEYVLREFLLHAKSESMHRKYLKYDHLKGVSPDEALPLLYESLPEEYKRNADTNEEPS